MTELAVAVAAVYFFPVFLACHIRVMREMGNDDYRSMNPPGAPLFCKIVFWCSTGPFLWMLVLSVRMLAKFGINIPRLLWG